MFAVRVLGAPIALLPPDKRLTVAVNLHGNIPYSVAVNGTALLQDSCLQLNLADQRLGERPQLRKKSFAMVSTTSQPVAPFANNMVANSYNLQQLDFANDFSVEFRAYNEG